MSRLIILTKNHDRALVIQKELTDAIISGATNESRQHSIKFGNGFEITFMADYNREGLHGVGYETTILIDTPYHEAINPEKERTVVIGGTTRGE